MEEKKVYTQAELEKAIEESFYPVLMGDGEFEISDNSQVRACGNSQVTAWDNSQVTACGNSQVTACGNSHVTAYDNSHVTAYGNSQVTAYGNSNVTAYDNSHVTAWDNSQVTAWDNSQVTAWDNSQVTACGNSQVRARDNSQVTACGNSHVTACGNSQVTACGNSQVTALGNSQVTALGNSQVTATQYVAITIDPQHKGKVAGGVQIKPPPVKTTEEWCDFYGVEVKRGIAILYKAVDDDYSTDNARRVGIFYKPGLSPVAPDWDGGDAECGYGLHFCPSPGHALDFNGSATHFIACPVKVSEIVVHFPAQYPTKVKAPRVYKPCFEVDINGNKI